MTEATVKAVAKRVPIIVMVGATSLENAVELAKHAHAAGADAISSGAIFLGLVSPRSSILLCFD